MTKDVEKTAIREMLAAERRTILARLEAMSADFDGIVAASIGSNSDDEHDPEGSTIAFERAQVAALILDARAALADLEDALIRLDDGTYGICVCCGGVIAPDRLAARPATRTCIACAAAGRPARPPSGSAARARRDVVDDDRVDHLVVQTLLFVVPETPERIEQPEPTQES
jgi:DnaK suppressor protein